MNETLERNLTNTIYGVGISIILTTLSYLVANYLGWASLSEINWLEAFAVSTSYLCTWLCVKQTRWNYPVGIVTTAAYSLLFWQFELTALAIFNLYLVFSLAYGYWRWGSDENTKPVTRTNAWAYLAYGALALGIYLLLVIIHAILGQDITPVDILIAVASGVAQFLLDNKKIETWFVWIGVNIASIWLFYEQHLYITMFQYVFFLANAFYGYFSWKQTIKEEDDLYEEDLKKLVFPDKPIIPNRTLTFD